MCCLSVCLEAGFLVIDGVFTSPQTIRRHRRRNARPDPVAVNSCTADGNGREEQRHLGAETIDHRPIPLSEYLGRGTQSAAGRGGVVFGEN